MKKFLITNMSICLAVIMVLLCSVSAYAETTDYYISELFQNQTCDNPRFINDTSFQIFYYILDNGSDRNLYFYTSVDLEKGSPTGTILPGYSVTLSGHCVPKIIDLTEPPLMPPEPIETEDDDYYLTPLEDELEALVESFKQAPSTEPTTVTWDKGTALPLNVMETLKENPSISLLFDFEYEGLKHTVLIPAGKAFADESIPWYGPLWLLEKYGEYNPEKKTSYTVKSGDTLGDIARANGMTIEELLKKNPQITNENLIYPGDEINL